MASESFCVQVAQALNAPECGGSRRMEDCEEGEKERVCNNVRVALAAARAQQFLVSEQESRGNTQSRYMSPRFFLVDGTHPVPLHCFDMPGHTHGKSHHSSASITR